MARVMILLFVLQVALAAAALISCLSTEEKIRRMPRWAWVCVIIFVPVIGAVAWFVTGRPVTPAAGGTLSRLTRLADPAAPARRPARPVAPDDDPEFLRSLNNRPGQPPQPTTGPDAQPTPEETGEPPREQDRPEA